MKPRKGVRSLAAVLCAALSWSAWAQEVTRGEKIEITGSSIKRIDAETALPVTIMKREEIARMAPANTEELLKAVSFTSSSGSTNVANSGAGGGQGGAGSTSLISLRGLGSARTLVLVNGRRVAPVGVTSAIDVNTIPVAAIERIEVLKDGASAIYGSDAIAGVINFILRKDYIGGEVAATFGAPTRHGGGDETRASLFGGFGDFGRDRYNVNGNLSYTKIKPIFGSDRPFASNLNVGEQLDRTSNTPFPANVRLPSGALRAPTYPDCGPFSLVSPLNPGICRYDNSPYIAIQPESDKATAMLNGRLGLRNDMEVYTETAFTRNKTRNTQQHVLINGAALPAGHPYITTLTNLINTQYSAFPQLRTLIGSAWAFLPPTSPYYPTAFAAANGLTGQPLVLLFRSIPSGVRLSEDIEDNLRLLFGLKGAAMGWDFDTGVLYSQNKQTNNLVQGWSLTDRYLTLINSGVINPFGPTTDPSALAAAMAANFVGTYNINTTSVTSVDFKASRDLFALPAGMIGLAIGGDLRKEKLDINPSSANRNFEVSGFGAPGVPLTASRNVESAFAEVNVPVLKGLEANAAVRFDDYQRVGNTTNPKGSIRWQPAENWLLRAAVGTGFRAPTLNDLYLPEARGITTNGQRDLIRCPLGGPTTDQDCSNQFVTILGGNPNLKPEKSRATTVGFLFEPIKDFSLGVDWFALKVKNVIRAGVPIATILADPVTYANLIRRGPPDGNPSGVGRIIGIEQTQTNLGEVRAAGLDVDVKAMPLNSAEGRVILRLNGTYLSKFDTQNLDGTFTNNLSQPSALGIGVTLRWRHTASATYERGPWTAVVAQNYQDSYMDLRTALQGASVPRREVAAYETFDAQVFYIGMKSMKLTLGVKNFTNRDPPYANHGAGFIGSYDLSYADVRGRFVYGAVQYNFR